MQNEKKLGAFIVTFNRPSVLKESIRLLLQQSTPPDIVLIVDNGEAENTRPVLEEFPDDKVIYRNTGDNLGSAGGFAYGVKALYDLGYEWIYCGDDDNPPTILDTIERLLGIAQSASNIGVVGATGTNWDWNKGEVRRLPDEILNGILEVEFIGQDQIFIVHRKVIEKVGLPNANLFFGYPDLEYSLRINQAGFRLLIDGKLMLECRKRYGRLNRKLTHSVVPRRSYNSIWRNYYTTRTYIFMMQHTFHRPDLARREALKAFGRSLFAWVKGPKYGAEFSLLQARGVWDGYRGRLGRTVMPRPKY